VKLLLFLSNHREEARPEANKPMAFPTLVAQQKLKPAANGGRMHRGLAVSNSANPHAAGDLARGVKDLLVQSR
jgi:hypothetical protein